MLKVFRWLQWHLDKGLDFWHKGLIHAVHNSPAGIFPEILEKGFWLGFGVWPEAGSERSTLRLNTFIRVTVGFRPGLTTLGTRTGWIIQCAAYRGLLGVIELVVTRDKL